MVDISSPLCYEPNICYFYNVTINHENYSNSRDRTATILFIYLLVIGSPTLGVTTAVNRSGSNTLAEVNSTLPKFTRKFILRMKVMRHSMTCSFIMP